jgi:alpha-mannosidase
VSLTLPNAPLHPLKAEQLSGTDLPSFARRVTVSAYADGDQPATFTIGDRRNEVTVQSGTGFIGQWDTRTWNRHEETLPPRPDAPPDAPPRKRTVLEYTGLTPGFIKPAAVATFKASPAYEYSYTFSYIFNVPPGARTMTLPANDKIHIVSITASDDGPRIRLVGDLR